MTPSNPVSEALRKFGIWCESDRLPPYLAAAEDAGFRRLWRRPAGEPRER